MQFTFRPLHKDDIKNIATWSYPEDYARYDGKTLVSGLHLFLFCRPFFRLIKCEFFAVDDERGKLVGLFQFMRGPSQTVTIGLGMHPDLTGQSHGIGLAFVKAGIEFGRQTYAPEYFRLLVASFNLRAIKVYESAGFKQIRPVKRFGPHGRLETSYEMKRKA